MNKLLSVVANKRLEALPGSDSLCIHWMVKTESKKLLVKFPGYPEIFCVDFVGHNPACTEAEVIFSFFLVTNSNLYLYYKNGSLRSIIGPYSQLI